MMTPRLVALTLGIFSLIVVACALETSRENIPPDWEQTSYVERGDYLVNHLGYCVGCHTPLGPDGQSDKKLLFSGVPEKFAGAKAGPPQVAGFPGPRGSRVYAKNITPDGETGIGSWSEEQFIRAFKDGVSPSGARYVVSPMEWNLYANMKDEDLRAIYRYLKTVKPIKNRVPANLPPK